jgi:hypothetical protein
MTDLATYPPTAGERLEAAGGISRGQLGRRTHRVLAELLATDRWPCLDRLAGLLMPVVGKVLAEHRLTKPDRAAAIKVTGAAAAYCWTFLPDATWAWVPAPAALEADVPRPLVWRGPDGELVGDVLLAGLHRNPLDMGWEQATALRDRFAEDGQQLDAIRLLTLAAPTNALLLTPTQPDNLTAGANGLSAVPLAASPLAALGGIDR